MEEVVRYDEVFDYLHGCQYPKDADKNKKRSIRQRAAMFEVRDGTVVLKGTTRQWVACKEQQQQVIMSCHDCCLGKCACIQKLLRGVGSTPASQAMA